MEDIDTLNAGRMAELDKSIADKILLKLNELQDLLDINKGRWVWELVQNAKDTVIEEEGRKVSVKVVRNKKSVKFMHNGAHFREDDIYSLTSQRTSKRRGVNEPNKSRKTGRFGTGFLTTHLLSKNIEVNGIYEWPNTTLSKFKFQMNRKPTNVDELAKKVNDTWKQFTSSLTTIDNEEVDNSDFNTTYKFHIEDDDQQEIASAGISEFIKYVPNVLVCLDVLDTVEIDVLVETFLDKVFPEG